MMQDSIITEEQHKEIIESLRNSSSITLSCPLTHLEENEIESFRHLANNLKKHAENRLPIEYEFTTNENRLSWLNYFNKSEMIGIEVPNEYSLHIIYIMQIYGSWYKHHQNVVQSQFLEYANQLVSININESTFIPSNCVNAFCDWYIRSIGSLNFGLSLDMSEDNFYYLTINIEYDFIQQIHTPMVLQRHLRQFFNEESENYLFPISTTAPQTIEQGKVNIREPYKSEKDMMKELDKFKQSVIDICLKIKGLSNSQIPTIAQIKTDALSDCGLTERVINLNIKKSTTLTKTGLKTKTATGHIHQIVGQFFKGNNLVLRRLKVNV